MTSFNFDLEIFCDIYYCRKYVEWIDSNSARVFTIRQRPELDQLEICRSQSLFIAVGLLQSGVSRMALLNVCLFTNSNVISYREVTVSV